MIEMLYSEPHQAISASVGVVCTTWDYAPQVAGLLRAVWPKPARWLSDNEDLWWFRAKPVREGQRDELLKRHWQGVVSAPR